jgi:hypothetical protein
MENEIMSSKYTVSLVITVLVMTGCNSPASPTSSSAETSQAASSETSTQKAGVTTGSVDSSSPALLPCEGKTIPIGQGNLDHSIFTVSTSPTSSDVIYLATDCTWSASWADKTWSGGGTAYNASGTYAFGQTALNDTITFYPSGLSFNVYQRVWRPNEPEYALSLRNPELLSNLWTVQNRADREVHTGLAFQDWIINTALGDNFCKLSQVNFDLCLADNYNPLTRINGKSSSLYRQ